MPAEAPDGKYLPPTDYPLERARPCPGPAGSVLIFNYRTIALISSRSARTLNVHQFECIQNCVLLLQVDGAAEQWSCRAPACRSMERQSEW